jgi:hypothetical protein
MTPPKQRGGHTCPHCKAKAVTYTSRKLSDIVTEQYVQCTNLECGCQYVVSVGIVRMTVASAMPSADVNVPLVARRANDIVVSRAAVATHTHAHVTPLPMHHEHTRLGLGKSN